MDTDLIQLISQVFGDKAEYILITLALIGYGWTLIRQFISAEKMSKLPFWAIGILEFIAGNKWESENSLYTNPKLVKKRKEYERRL